MKRASQDVGLSGRRCAWARTFSTMLFALQLKATTLSSVFQEIGVYMGAALHHVVEGQKRKLQSFSNLLREPKSLILI